MSNKERLGITLAADGRLDIPVVCEIARRAESLGFEIVWMPETWGTDLASALAVLATSTSSIQVGSGIFNVYSRSPALLAQTAATLQNLSKGRFLLGIGASGPAVVENWHGVSYGDPLQRTREYVDILRLALSGERVDYRGNLFQLRDFKLGNPPVTSIPIYIAALGPANVELTGRIADGWLPIFAARDHFAPYLERLHTAETAALRLPGSVKVHAYIPCMMGPRGPVMLRQQLAYYVGGMGTFYARYVSRLGFEDDVKRIRTLWQEGLRRAAVEAVSEEVLAACTLGSEPREARRRLSQYREQGIDVPIVSFPHGSTREEIESTLEALAPDSYNSA